MGSVAKMSKTSAKPSSKEEESEPVPSTREFAELICAEHPFARDAGGKLYVFRDGCYQPNGDSAIRQAVKQVLKERELLDEWSSRIAPEVAAFVALDAPELLQDPPVDRVNVLNGILNLSTNRLEPHSPDFLSPVQLPVLYDPKARCPAWEKFISEVFPPDAIKLAWQIVGWLMVPDTAIQKAVLLLGDGSNGKSTYLRAALAFIGRHNASAVSLHRLEHDRFSAARLVGKLANICPDLPGEDLSGTSVFKAITGGDVMLAERKFKDSFEFDPFAKLVFSANRPPKSRDASPAFFRRWVVVRFNRTFDERSRIPRDELDARLAAPNELSGVLNKALVALAEIRKTGRFHESQSTRDALAHFREVTDPLAAWLDRNVVRGADQFIPVETLWGAYRDYCEASGHPIPSKKALSTAMSTNWKVESQRKTYRGVVAWCYLGVGLRAKSRLPYFGMMNPKNFDW